MNPERLWAPWRMTYIKGIGHDENTCVFCEAPKMDDDRKALVLYRGKVSFVILNLYPYNNGHMMVVPYMHTADMLALPDETSAEMWKLVCKCKEALTQAFHPDGFNIGLNQGRVAGAGIDQHIHMHIVPRWSGDTNFMPVVGETKVISQGLEETWDELKKFLCNPGTGE
ncbi:MAG: HIT domain-containing protein [Chitinivibrionales bacterium]|nr:HIT domain-containing protein [Chitinivibrionales bacterium]